MAFYDSGDALYGIGRYGSASYGIVEPVVQITGVSATAVVRTLHLNAFEIDVSEKIYAASALQGSVGSVTLHLTEALDSVSATTAVSAPTLNIAFTIDSVEGTNTANAVEQVAVTEKLDSVSATFTINDSGIDIRSINRVPVTGPAAMTGAIGTVETQPTEALLSVSATGYVNSVQVNVAEVLNSVAGTGAVNTVTVHGVTAITGVVATFATPTIQLNPDEVIFTGVQGTSAVSGVTTHVVEKLVSAAATGSLGTINTTAVVFDFNAVRTQYSRRRTVYISRVA
jgi:hypothetical protein